MRTADHTVLIASLAVGAAIVAAMIASATAIVVQRRQLKHNRELQDLAELRSVLDEAVLAFEDAIYALTWEIVRFDGTTDETETDEETKRILKRERMDADRKAMDDSSAARDGMMRAGRRIAIRIPANQPLRGAYAIAIDIVIGTKAEVHAKQREMDAGESVSSNDFRDRAEELAIARNTVVKHAQELVGSKI
jgi:hypothetical protein